MASSAAGSIRIVWSPDTTNIIYRIKKARKNIVAKNTRVMEDFAAETTEWMKDTAPWRDQSGAARGSLTAQVTSASGDRVILDAGYDLGYLLANQDPPRDRDYSIYLEGYLDLSILQPTFDWKFPQIMDRVTAGHVNFWD